MNPNAAPNNRLQRTRISGLLWQDDWLAAEAQTFGGFTLWLMNKRAFLGQLGLVTVGGGLALVGRDIILDRDSDRRFALYNIMRELRKGMSRAEVESVISRHDAPFIRKDTRADLISLSVMLGRINQLYLALEFTREMLSKARFGGEDNPQDVPKDAPSNIE